MENKKSSISSLLKLIPIIAIIAIIITFVLIFNMKNKIIENNEKKVNNENKSENKVSYIQIYK